MSNIAVDIAIVLLSVTYRPTGSETHFKVVVISDRFSDARTAITRHRLVNDALREEVAADGPVHALSIVAMTPEKWQERLDKGEVVGPSPNCRGGDGSLPKKNDDPTIARFL